MEPESPGTRSGNTKNENAAQSGGSRQKRRSTGNNSPKSKRVQRGRHSWHETPQVDHGYSTRRKSLDVSLKNADIKETDERLPKEDLRKQSLRSAISKDRNPQKEEELCKKTLQETILKLNKDVDVQSWTLLDLVNQISSLAEERDNMVKTLSTKAAEDGEKIANLEEILTERKIEIDNLYSEKNRLELFVKEEQGKFIRVENQLKETLAKVKNFSREVESYVNKSICDSDSLPHPPETASVPEEGIRFKSEKSTLPLEEEDDMDSLLKGALTKISALFDENKKLEKVVLSYEKAKIFLKKFNRRFLELEEKFKGNEATVQRIRSNKQLDENLEVAEAGDNRLTEQNLNDNEATVIKDENGDETLAEELYSKIDLLERLSCMSESYTKKIQHEIEVNEGLKKKVNKLDELFEEVRQTMSKAKKENDNLCLLLEREKQKFSSLELALVGKEKELEMLRQNRQFAEIETEVKELIKRVADLNAEKLEAEEEKCRAQFEMKNSKDELSGLKVQLEECQGKVLSLTSSNEELQQLLNSEKNWSMELKNELQVALEKVDALTEEISEISEKFRSKEEELMKGITDDKNKILELEGEVHSKTQALDNVNLIIEEYKMQLVEEKSINKSLEERLSKSINKEFEVYLEEDIKEILVLKDQLENCHMHLSEMNPENDFAMQNSIGENNSFPGDFWLKPVLETMKNVSGKMGKLSERMKEKVSTKLTNADAILKDAESQSNVSLENIKEERPDMTASKFVEVNLYEQVHIKQERLSLGHNMEMTYREDAECSIVHNNTSISNERMLDTTMLVDLQGKISSLEEELANAKIDLDKVIADKSELGLLLKDEAERAQDYEKKLKNAQNEIAVLSQMVSEAKCNEEEISAQLSQEMEKCKQLEDELEASEVVVANLAESEEECILQLKEMIICKMSLEEELQKARETITDLCEESKKLKNEMETEEKESKTTELRNEEEISRRDALTQTQLKAIDEVHKEKEKIELEVNTYKERIAELEKTVEENLSALLKLGAEKGELETLLQLEKENSQKASLQLSEALAHHDDADSRINQYETKISELQEVVARNESAMSTLGEEKAKVESFLILEKENGQKMSTQLMEASADLEFLRVQISLFETFMVNHEKLSEKIAVYEKDISNLQEIEAVQKSEISSLGVEKAKLESFLILEKENSQKVSSQLKEASTHLDSLTDKLLAFEKMVVDNEKLSEKIVLYEKEILDLKEIEAMYKSEISSLETEKARLEFLVASENETSQRLALQLGEASEKLEKFTLKIQHYERKVLDSEEVIIANESAMFKLATEKEELESKLVSEKENGLKLTSQLSSTTSSLENVQKEINESCVKSDTEELASLLYAEIQKVEKLEKEIEIKKEELVCIKNREQELIAMLEGEKCRNNELEEKIQKLQAEVTEGAESNQPLSVEKEKGSNEGEVGKIEKLNKKVLELEDFVVRLHIEKEELESILVSEKGNSRRMSSQLSEALLNFENVSKELGHSSGTKKEVEELSTELETKTQELESLRQDMIKKESECEELREKFDQLRPEELEKIPEYERKISELEEVIIANEYSYAKVCVEKKELEALLASERENQKKTGKHLSEALLTLDSITSAMMKTPDPKEISCLEEKLKAEQEKVENLNSKIEEMTFELEQEKSKHEELQEKLQSLEADTTIRSTLENSNVGVKLCNHVTSSEKMPSYSRKLEMEDTLSNHASENSKIWSEKVELDSLLLQEEENRRKIYSELTVALINLDNLAGRINEPADCNKDAEELSLLLENETQKVKELEEQLENKEKDVEILGSKLGELKERLSKEKSRQEQLEVNRPESLAKDEIQDMDEEKVPEVMCEPLELSQENPNEKVMTENLLTENEKSFDREAQVMSIEFNQAFVNLENAMVTIKSHEKVIDELKELADNNSMEISRLGKEKEEAESLLESEKEKHSKTWERLCKALAGIHDASGKVADYEKRICQLVEFSEKNANDISKTFVEKGDIECQTALEQEQFQNLSLQYSEAVVKLENETAKVAAYEEIMQEMKSAIDLKAHEVSRLEEGKAELESKLNLEKETLKNTSLQLKKTLSSLKAQSQILLSYEATIDRLKDLDENNSSEIAGFVKEKLQMESKLAEEQDKYVAVFNQLSTTSTDLENESAKISEYEKAMGDLKISVNAKASEILRLCQEKSEVEVQLELEKENLHKASFQLSEAVINLENESAKASAFEKLAEEMKLQLDSYSSKISALEKEKEQLESQLRVEKENASLQLSEALSRFEAESECYEKAIKEWKETAEMRALEIIRLGKANQEMESQLGQEKGRFEEVSNQLSEVLFDLEKETTKCEKLSEDWRSSVAMTTSEIPRLCQEKNEIESLLKEEREKLQTVSAQLSEAMVNLENKSTKYSEAMKEWMDVTTENRSEIASLLKEKNELEQQLDSGKAKLQETSLQLSEALACLESQSAGNQKTIMEWKDAAEMRACEISRLSHEKNEMEQLLNEEREKLQDVSMKLEEASANLESASLRHEEVVKELREAFEIKASELSKVSHEKSEIEIQLSHDRESLKNATDQLNEALAAFVNESAKYEQVVREWKDTAEMRGCEISRLSQEKDDMEQLLNEEREKLQDVSLKLEEASANLESTSLRHEEVVKELREAFEMKASELSRLSQEKSEIEMQLTHDRESLKNVTEQLNEALAALVKGSAKYEQVVREWKDTAEMRGCEISSLCQVKYEMQELLIHEREKLQVVSTQLDEASANLESMSFKHEEVVKELRDTAEVNASELSRLSQEKSEIEMQLTYDRESLKNVTEQLNETLAAFENESAKYEQVVREWKDTAEMRACEILRLNQQRDEMESLWSQEKENFQNVLMQLKEAEIRLENISSKLSEKEALIEQLNEQSDINSSEISKLKLEKEETEAKLILERDNLQSVTSQLNEALFKLESESVRASTYGKDVQDLKEQVEVSVSGIRQIAKEKEEVESQLIQERKNSHSLSKQISEGFVTIENLTKELNCLYDSDKKAAELSSLLKAEAQKVKQMGEELTIKDEKFKEYQESQTQLLSEARNKVIELEMELERLAVQSEEFTLEIQTQKTISENKDLELTDLLAKINSYEHEVNRLSDMETQSTATISDHVAKISELELFVEDCKKEITTLTSRGEELESQLHLEKENSRNLNLLLQDSMVQVDSLSQDIKNLSDDCSRKEEEINTNRSAVEKLAEKYDWQLNEESRWFEVVDKELDQFFIQISNLNKEKELLTAEQKEKNEIHSKELERLMVLIENKEAKLSTLTSENEELRVSIDEKGTRLISIQDQLDSALQEIENITQKLSELSSELEKSQKNESETFKTMKAELESAKCAQSESTKNEKELANLFEMEKNKVEDLMAQLSGAESTREEMARKNQELADSMDAVSQQLQCIMKDYEKSSENEMRLMGINEKLSVDFELKKDRLSSCELEINRLEGELNARLSENQELESKTKEITEQMESLQTLVKESKSELSLMSSERDRLDEDLQLRDVQLRDVQNQLTNTQLEVEDIKAKLEEASMNLRNKEEEGLSIIKSLREELETTKYALSVCATSEEELASSLKAEKDRVNILTKQLHEQKSKMEDLSSKNLELNNVLECVNEKLSLVLEEQSKVDEREKNLKTINEVLTSKLEKLKECLGSTESELAILRKELLAKAEIVLALENKNVELLENSECLKNLLNQGKSVSNSLQEENNNLLVMVDSKSKEVESVLEQLNSAQQNINSLKNNLNEVKNQLEDNKLRESERMQSMKSELEEVKLALEARAKHEDELNTLLIAEKNKADELNRKLKEEMFKNEAAASKNKELTSSIQMLEQQLTVFLDENKTRNEREASDLATIKELNGKLKNLEDDLYSAKLTNTTLRAELQVKSSKITVYENKNLELTSLVESGNKKTSMLEVSIKDLNEKLMSKERQMVQMQIALEKAESKVNSLASEAELLKKHKESETLLRGKVTQLEASLREANDSMKRLSEANVEELETVKRNCKESILEMKEKMNTISRELIDVKKTGEIRISTLQKEIKLEKEKHEKRAQELAATELSKTEISEQLEQLKNKLSNLEQRLVKEGEKAIGYEQKFETAKVEIKKRSQEILRMKKIENELKSHLEVGRRKAISVEGELAQIRASLLSSSLKQDELKSEIINLEAKVQREAALAKQLGMQLENERTGHESAKEAEKRLLQVISTQEKEIALLKSGISSSESSSSAEVQLLKFQAEEKDRQIEACKKELIHCKKLIQDGEKGQASGTAQKTGKIDFGVQTAVDEPSSTSKVSEVRSLYNRIDQLEKDKEFLKELCRRRHKQREDLKKELVLLSSKSTTKELENKENVNANV